jgi:hypothetical protein
MAKKSKSIKLNDQNLDSIMSYVWEFETENFEGEVESGEIDPKDHIIYNAFEIQKKISSPVSTKYGDFENFDDYVAAILKK